MFIRRIIHHLIVKARCAPVPSPGISRVGRNTKTPSGKILATAMVMGSLLASISRANDWPNYRGPNHDGLSTESGWTTTWPEGGPPVLWKANVGVGFSSFAVANNRAYTCGNADNIATVFCFDAETGKVLWKYSYPSDLGDHDFEGGTTSTPTVDGDRVYVIGRAGDLFCFEVSTGKVVWQINIHDETKIRVPDWGFGGSPLVMGERLILNVGEAGVALDKATGKVVWKSGNEDAGYSTPVPMTAGGKPLVMLTNKHAFLAVDPQDGTVQWKIKWATQYGANAADPIINGDRALVSSGYGKGSALLQSASGDPKTIWKNRSLRVHLNPAVRLGDFVFGLDGDYTDPSGALKCIEFATGNEKWTKPDFGPGSLIIADGRLIILNEKGELMIAPASADVFKPIAHAQVLDGKCWTSPVLANGRIYCRDIAGDVVCLNVRGK